MRKNKKSKNWTCVACRHIGKPHPLDSTDLCRSSSWKHQQSRNFLSFLPQTSKRYIPAWVRKACNWCCNRKEENHKADKANPLSLSQHCNFHSCSLLLSSLIKLPQFWNIEIYNNTQHHDSRSYIRWWILSYLTFCILSNTLVFPTGQKPMGFPHLTYTKVYSFYFQRCVIKTVD